MIFISLDEKVNSQIIRTREQETSPKNTTLYFNILLKSKDLIYHKVLLLEEFYKSTRLLKEKM